MPAAHPVSARPSSMRAVQALVLILFAAAVTAVPTLARAAVPDYSVEQLAGMSATVVLADVDAVSSRLLVPGPGQTRAAVVTDVDLSVVGVWKGASPESLRLTVPGGSVGGVRMVVSEAPFLAAGRRYVVFVAPDGQVTAGEQGAPEVIGTAVPAFGTSLGEVAARVGGAWDGVAVAGAVTASSDGGAVTAAAGSPVITSITPARQPGGIGAVITIAGTGFGDAPGTVTFAYDGATRTPGRVTTWTDTRIDCEVPTEASSGNVIAASAAGAASGGFDYDVGYSYAGLYWPSPVMTYRVNPNCWVAGLDEVGLVGVGAAAWNGGGSPFRFAYTGATSQTAGNGNSVNEVFWTTGLPAGIPAMSQMWFDYSGRLAEVDVMFSNSTAYKWGDGSNGTLDVATIAVHELGHALALGDQYGFDDRHKVMHGVATWGIQRRTLSPDDIAGLQHIYGAGTAPVLPPGPLATAVSIRSSASRVAYPRPFVLTGVLTPGAAGDPVIVEVRRPGSARWSYSSARLAYTSSGGSGLWWYRYTPRLRGTYNFRARFAATADRLGSLSRTIAVSVR